MREKRTINNIEVLINQTSRIAGIIALITLILMMLVTVADVVLRYFFNAPILGSNEIVEYLMVITGFLGLGWCAIKGGHLKVGLIIDRMPSRYQTVTDIVTFILALSVVPLLVWQAFSQAEYTLLEKCTSDVLKVPNYPFYIIEGIGIAIFTIVILMLLIKLIAGLNKK